MPYRLIELGIVAVLLLGIALFRGPGPARLGNLTAALALGCGAAMILARYRLSPAGLIVFMTGLGSVAGWVLAMRVTMIRIPAMVALQNGMGGLASFLVAFVELTRSAGPSGEPALRAAALSGMVIGAATLTGSLLAAGRLANLLDQRPRHLPRHHMVLGGLAGAVVLLSGGAMMAVDPTGLRLLAGGVVLAAGGLGGVLAVRVGGADMPVLISFLNAGTGLAAAFCGLAVGSWLLVACGAMVGVSGTILTQIMCRAMNRRLAGVLAGSGLPPVGASSPPNADAPVREPPEAPRLRVGQHDEARGTTTACGAAAADPLTRAVDLLRAARSVIIVPGYGMALAGAQEETVQLAEQLAAGGRLVVFAIHPVAGRMPGHMHVLLAEAEVDYGMIREMDDVNPRFAETDVALIVGACDVVNPAAIQREGTPISGMPILRAHEAAAVVVCNLDDRPGYSGVENPLYRQPHTVMLTGDARETLQRLRAALG